MAMLKRSTLTDNFWATLSLFFHPRLRLLLARHIYGAINKPILEFSPNLGEKMASIMTDILTVDEVHKLLLMEAIKHKQDRAIYDEQRRAVLPIHNTTELELIKSMEALVYLFENQLPHPILPATGLEIRELKLYEPLIHQRKR